MRAAADQIDPSGAATCTGPVDNDVVGFGRTKNDVVGAQIEMHDMLALDHCRVVQLEPGEILEVRRRPRIEPGDRLIIQALPVAREIRVSRAAGSSASTATPCPCSASRSVNRRMRAQSTAVTGAVGIVPSIQEMTIATQSPSSATPSRFGAGNPTGSAARTSASLRCITGLTAFRTVPAALTNTICPSSRSQRAAGPGEKPPSMLRAATILAPAMCSTSVRMWTGTSPHSHRTPLRPIHLITAQTGESSSTSIGLVSVRVADTAIWSGYPIA